ncbi:MAG: BtaA family protein, partial [Bacteroidota bacterium]
MTKRINKLRDWVFSQVHTSNLVYNTCWEDPRCDRELMQFNSDSEIVMITSAGCNALDYLLDSPKQINCIDMNPRQNALLQLKLAAFQTDSWNDLFKLFGNGVHDNIKDFYQKQLRPSLENFASSYWDQNYKFFNGKGPRKTFYYYGTSGSFAWLASKYLKTQKSLYRNVRALFNSSNMEEQSNHYFKLEEQFFNKFVEWLMNRHLTMSMLGIPRAQQDLFMEKYDRGAIGYIQECFRNVFTKLPIQENYFWQLYVNGNYTEDCCPNYLKEEHFEDIKGQVDKITTNNTTISEFLKNNPKKYSHFILLDHQDWLASHNVAALEEEWQLILENSKPGTR